MKKTPLKKLVSLAMLLAITIVLSRFLSISLWNIKIGFSFVPILICAYLYGPYYAGGLAAITDLLGALLFPIGAYFPGFTFTALLSGVVCGLFLKEKSKTSNLKILYMVLINQLIIGLVINTMFINVLYSHNYYALIVSRIPQYGVMIPIEFIICKIMLKYFDKRKIC